MSKPDLSKLLTIYGRKPVLEALMHPDLTFYCLHLASSNKPDGIVADIIQQAKNLGVQIKHHNKKELSRISKNAKQDQGVALDIHMPDFIQDDDFLNSNNKLFKLIALDGITNPQNLGMIIRSVCASPMTGLLLPTRGCAKLDSLVIKASAGTLFHCPVIFCDHLEETLKKFLANNTEVYVLDSHSQQSLFEHSSSDRAIYVLGNESDGVQETLKDQATAKLKIPLNNKVESLNVAVTAALVAFSIEQ